MINFKELFIDPIFGLRNSDRFAFCINDELFTYKQLFDYVEQIYAATKDIDDNIVCLYATDDIRTYASILALWLCGKAYVPLNPSQPKERHAEVINSVHTHTIFSADANYTIPMEGVSIVYTSDFSHEAYVRKNIMQIAEVCDDTLAYIIFTSGVSGSAFIPL